MINEAIAVFLMMATMIKPVMWAQLLNQGISAYSGLQKKVRHKNAIFSQGMQKLKMVYWYAKKATTPRKCVKIIMSWLNAGVSGTQSMRWRMREDEGPPKA